MCYFTSGTAVISLVTDPTQVRVLQGAVSSSVALIGYVQPVAAFVLLSLVDLYLFACCLCSTECRTFVGGYFIVCMLFHTVPISIIQCHPHCVCN